MEIHSKGEFHVLVKELKLFDREFFFKHIATRHFDFSQRCFTAIFLFCLIICCIQHIHWLIILPNNLFCFGAEFFRTEKKISSARKGNYFAFSRCACAKLKVFLSAEKFLKWTPAFIVRKEKIVN